MRESFGEDLVIVTKFRRHVIYKAIFIDGYIVDKKAFTPKL